MFQATGNHSPAEIKPKGTYMNVDLQRFAQRYGVPFTHNPHFPINTLLLMRGATGLQMHEPERFEAYCRAIYQAMWVDAQNMNDLSVVGTVLQAAGFDAGAAALAGQPDVKERLKAVTGEGRGVRRTPPCSSATRCSGARTARLRAKRCWPRADFFPIRSRLSRPNSMSDIPVHTGA